MLSYTPAEYTIMVDEGQGFQTAHQTVHQTVHETVHQTVHQAVHQVNHSLFLFLNKNINEDL